MVNTTVDDAKKAAPLLATVVTIATVVACVGSFGSGIGAVAGAACLYAIGAASYTMGNAGTNILVKNDQNPLDGWNPFLAMGSGVLGMVSGGLGPDVSGAAGMVLSAAGGGSVEAGMIAVASTEVPEYLGLAPVSSAIIGGAIGALPDMWDR